MGFGGGARKSRRSKVDGMPENMEHLGFGAGDMQHQGKMDGLQREEARELLELAKERDQMSPEER